MPTQGKPYIPTGKTYEMNKISDLFQLTPEQQTLALQDLASWLEARGKILQNIKAAMKLLDIQGPLSDFIVLPETFEWIDDGVLGGKTKMTMEFEV